MALDGFINQWESEQSFEDTRIQLIPTTSVNGQSVVYSGSWLKDVSNNVYHNGGNVGIGTSMPNYMLDVSGEMISTRYFLKHESGSTTLSSISVNETVDNFTVEKDATDTKYIVKNSSGSNDLDMNELMATLILEIRDLKARVSALENV